MVNNSTHKNPHLISKFIIEHKKTMIHECLWCWKSGSWPWERHKNQQWTIQRNTRYTRRRITKQKHNAI